MYDINMASPTVADDMVLVSYSKNGLERMLKICYEYANRWRFLYNASKCSVLVYNKKTEETSTFYLGHDRLPASDKYTHLGIECNSFLTTNNAIHDACVRLRGTYMSLCSKGVAPERLSQPTLSTIFNSSVIPKALYGCELWNNNSQSDLVQLSIAHNFCLKHMQGYDINISTDYCLSTINTVPIVNELEIRKLTFFGQICRLNPKYLAKDIFNNRLIRHIELEGQCIGYIPDAYRILQKYDLMNVLRSYVQDGNFPTKRQWKKIVERKVVMNIKNEIQSRIKGNDQWGVTVHVIDSNNYSPLWRVAKDNPRIIKVCKTIMNSIGMFVSRQYVRECRHCCLKTVNLVIHKLCYCHLLEDKRKHLWTTLIECIGITEFSRFIHLSGLEQSASLLKMISETVDSYFVHFKLCKAAVSILN